MRIITGASESYKNIGYYNVDPVEEELLKKIIKKAIEKNAFLHVELWVKV